jgi:hypothetical protein
VKERWRKLIGRERKGNKYKETRKCSLVNFAESESWLEDLRFIGTIPRCVVLYVEKAQPSKVIDEEQIDGASLSVVTSS